MVIEHIEKRNLGNEISKVGGGGRKEWAVTLTTEALEQARASPPRCHAHYSRTANDPSPISLGRSLSLKVYPMFDDDNTGGITFKNLKRVAAELGETLDEKDLHVSI